MRFRIDLAAALLCAAACAFADTSQPVTLTLKIQIIAKTSVAYDYDYSDSNGSTADHATDLLNWTAESSEVWSGTWYSSPNFIFLDNGGNPISVSVVRGASGAGSASEVFQGGGCGYYSRAKATWQYPNLQPRADYEQSSLLLSMGSFNSADAPIPFTLAPWLDFFDLADMEEPPVEGTQTIYDCHETTTDDWSADAYPSAGYFMESDWEDMSDDDGFKALWAGNLDRSAIGPQSAVNHDYHYIVSHNGDTWFGGPDGMTQTGSTDIEIKMTLSLNLGALVNLPAYPSDDCNCQTQGSIVGVQDQSLGEAVPVMGTPYRLRYQSDRMPGRIASSGYWTANNLALGGWTLNVLHAYDSKAGILYLGSGTRRSGQSVHPIATADGGFLIPSQDSNEVYQFNSAGVHTATLDQFTGAPVYSFVYDSSNRLTGVKDVAGNLTTIQRSGAKPTAIVGPFGQKTTLSVDSNGYLSRIQNPDGSATAFTYGSKGLMARMTDPNGNEHDFAFDSSGLLLEDDDPAGAYQALQRTAVDSGYAVTQTTADQLTTTYTVTNPGDGAGFQTQLPDGSVTTGTKSGPFFGGVTSPTGMATSVTYGQDPRWGLQAKLPAAFTTTTPGGVASVGTLSRTIVLSDPANPLSLSSLQDSLLLNGRTSTASWSASSRTLTATSAAGRSIVRTLDALGRTLTHQSNGLAPWQLTYDAQGRLSALTRGSGDQQRTWKYEYASDGLPSGFTDPLGQASSFKRDKAGRVTGRTQPDGGAIAYAYDANGNMTSVTPPGRPAHTFDFTPANLPMFYSPPMVSGSITPTGFFWNPEKQLWQVSRSDGGSVTRHYDSLGHVAALSSSAGQLTYTYDPQTGQRTQVSDGSGNSLAYAYDGDLPLSYTWAGAVAGQVQFTYDADFRVTSVAANGGSPLAITYDPDSMVVNSGNLALTRDPASGLIAATTLDGIADAPVYNSFGELTQYTATGPNGTLLAAKYTRDKLGRVTDKTETIGSATSAWHYGYDTAGRLVSVDQDGAAAARYTYDLNGNRTKATVSGTTETATFDNQDRLTARGAITYQYSADGELSSTSSAGQQTQVQYDALGNLRRVSLPRGKEIRYLTDGENRRIGKLVNGTLAKGFLYQDSLRPAAELDGSGNVVSLFVYGDGGLAPLYMIKGGVKYRILTDHLGSPRLVVNSATGEIAQRIDYDAFGAVTADSSPGFQPFGFAGGLYDPDTGLVRFGARDYDSAAGRWTAKDPRGLAGGDTNLYAYVGNDPVNHLDPRGADSGGDSPLAPLVPPDDPLAPLVPPYTPDDPLAPLVPPIKGPPDDPIVPLVPPVQVKVGRVTPCQGPTIIWVKRGNGPWMPWYVTPNGAWPANPMGPW